MRVCIIGAGPAGMMAAIAAAERNLKVSLWDKNGFGGKKLNITGKGRCNITNLCSRDEFLQNMVNGGKFLQSAFSRFTPMDVCSFFEELGLPLKQERGRRVFPESGNAFDVSGALIRKLKSLGVSVEKMHVERLVINNDEIIGVESKGKFYPFERVILASGGASYPSTGSDGGGFKLASGVGHNIEPPEGSLVGLISPDASCGEMQGLSLRNVSLKLRSDTGAVIWKDGPGEMLFTHFGVSGPLVLSASAFWREGYYLGVDLKPGLDEEQLENRLLRDFKKYANRELTSGFGDLLHKSMIPVIINKLEMPKETRLNAITRKERTALIRLLKDYPVKISSKRPISEAVVTRGGVLTTEVNPKTMESKLVKGLFFAGEILNADALTGGYNLQIAWSTGRAAGVSV